MEKFVKLGKAARKSGTALAIKPKTVEDRLAVLETMVHNLMRANLNLRSEKKRRDNLNAYDGVPLNKNGVPIGISLIGLTAFGPRILTVLEDGYYIGETKYNSLSAAAEAASGIVRKSGWVFWKLPDGRSLKQAFKRARNG